LLRCRGNKDPGWYNGNSLAKAEHYHPNFSLPIWKPLEESLEYQCASQVDSNRNREEMSKGEGEHCWLCVSAGLFCV